MSKEMPSVASKTGIFHLVRKANGLGPFEAFLRSFRLLRKDGDAQLILIFKGFVQEAEWLPFQAACRDVEARHIFVSDEGFDITAYIKAVEQVQVDFVLLFNSFSEILSPDCYLLFKSHMQRSGVGMVGATGSLESTASSYRDGIKAERNPIKRLLKYGKALYLAMLFPFFPNQHLRTNAIMLRRDDFLAAKRRIRSKMEAHRFESGRRSLSRLIQRKGLDLVLVDRSGRALQADAWATAAVFRDCGQENLLVADNQTRAYQEATETRRHELRIAAWGCENRYKPKAR